MKFVAFDVETSGVLPEYALQPWRVRQKKAWLTSLAWVWREPGAAGANHAGGLAPTRKMICTMLEWALDTDHVLVGWNVAFDISWLYAYADTAVSKLINQAHFVDAMLLWRHLDLSPEHEQPNRARQRSYSLKAAVPEFFPEHAGYEAEINYHGDDPEELRKLHEYNVKDCVFTLRLARMFWRELNPRQQVVATIEAQALKPVARANLEGLVINPLETGHLSASLKQVAAERLRSLAPHGVTEKIVRSPKKLGALLYDQWRLPVMKMTDSGARSTDKVVLFKLAQQDARVREIKEYREALNNDTKFAAAPLAACAYNEDHRAHPEAHVFSTYSGRMTYSSKQGRNKNERQTGFALHQEKRDPRFRRIVAAPPGFDLMEFDAAGQEYRWMAIASGDAIMLRLCQSGEDPHAFMGSKIEPRFTYAAIMKNAKIAGSPEASLRQCAKVANLSLQYRTSAKRLQQVAEIDHNITLTLDKAVRIHEIYRRTYVMIPRYWLDQIVFARVHGYVETIPGRRIKIIGQWGGELNWQMESTAINYRIQGTGAEQKYLALMFVREYLDRIGARFAWDLHDGLYFYVPSNKVYDAAHYMKDILDNLPYEDVWGFKLPIPMPWDCKVGPSWGDLKPFEFK